jgi:hypothetical protein
MCLGDAWQGQDCRGSDSDADTNTGSDAGL